jgi:hypothetical protein
MRENCTSGTARGVPGNRHSYRRELLARRLPFLCELLQACGGLWGATRTPFFRRVARALKLPLSLLEPLLRLGGRLCSCPLLGGHGA